MASDMVNDPNTVEICKTAPLPYLLINVNVTQLSWKKPLFVICKILGLFVITLAADNKYSVLRNAL